MVLDIKMCRFDNVPWGFRLVGGADYEYPLTVVKVAEGSIADEAGLCVEDVIVRINDTAAMPLTHDEAHRLITSSGSVFYFGVYREHEEEVEEGPRRFPISSSSLTKSPTPTLVESPPVTAWESTDQTLLSEQEPSELEASTKMECCSAETEMHPDDFSYSMSNDNKTESLFLPELPDRPCSALSGQAEVTLVEQEIAAVLSGESEVLKEHNVLGVNFYRIFPKPGVCMTSDVLRSLNEEVTKTKLEKDKENRKWSTFLQRPDRPVPKSKQQLESERRAANAYKVKIVKTAPRDKSPMPETKPVPKEAEPNEPTQTQTEKEESLGQEATPLTDPNEAAPTLAEAGESLGQVESEEEEPLPTNSEVPNLEQLSENGDNYLPEEVQDEQPEKADALKDESEGQSPVEATTPAADLNEQPQENTQEVQTPKTEEELSLEKQLADVQKQLAALSSLPSTIQSTLDAVTKQLAELLPTFKLCEHQPKIDEPQEQQHGELATDGSEAMTDSVADVDKPGSESEATEAATSATTAPYENNENNGDANDQEVAEISFSYGDNRELDGQFNEEQSFKKQKKHNVIEELEEHLVRKNNPKRSKRAFGPLVPSSERPLVLPGGRRWYRPKDAYNDEFIAETLSAQAELITGSTLGLRVYCLAILAWSEAQSARTSDPLSLFINTIALWNRLFNGEHISRQRFRELQGMSVAKAAHRVNFMKYQKPERKIDLNRSEVYKVIHHLDRAPIRGIEVRAPLVAAESDIRQSLQS